MNPIQARESLPHGSLDHVARGAEEAVRLRLRRAIFDVALTADDSVGGSLDEIEEAVCAVLCDPDITWALDFLRGVAAGRAVMERAQPPPPLASLR